MLLVLLIALLTGTLVALFFAANALWHTLRTGLPYVTTPSWAIDWLVSNLELRPSDAVYELGCGDARVIAALAKKFPDTRFVGIEIQLWPYLLARWRVRQHANIHIIRGNLYTQDLRPATLVYGFYITAFVERLSQYLQAQLAPNTRVFSFGFKLPGWQPVQQVQNPNRAIGGSQLIEYRARPLQKA